MSETKTFDAKVTKIGDEIASLSLKEAVDLAEYMKDKYGIEAAAGGAVMMAAGGAARLRLRRRPSSMSSSTTAARTRSR